MPRLARAEIRKRLCASDPVLAQAVRSVDYPKRSTSRELYLPLVRSIIAQQISLAAAQAVSARLFAALGSDRPDPAVMCSWSDSQFRDCGVSRQKAGYLRAVAEWETDGRLDITEMRKLSDDAVIRHITQIHGVGRWTVEMLLLFPLDRPDVFPVDDVGIQRAMQDLYGWQALKGKALLRQLTEQAEKWRPWRSHATKCLWMWWENAPGVDW